MKHCIGQKRHFDLLKQPTLALLGILFCILVIAGEMFRRLPLDDSLAFWTVVPPLLLPTWLQCRWDAFLWTKTLSLIPVAVIWCSVVRLGIDDRWTRLGSVAVLSLNIAEAVVKDMLSNDNHRRRRQQGRVVLLSPPCWNQLNAISGVLLILLELPTMHTIQIRDDGIRDFLWTQGPSWIIAYTIWNLMFVYGNYPYSIGRHFVVLMAPLTLVCRNGWDTWLQARGYTLAFYFMIRCTFYYKLRAWTDVRTTAATDDDHEMRLLQVVSFTCVVLLLALNNVPLLSASNDESIQYKINRGGKRNVTCMF